MEGTNAALFLLLSALLLLVASLKIINSSKQQQKIKEAPGPWNLPIVGSLHRMLGSKLPHHVFRGLSAVYGPIMRLKLGEIHVVVVSSAEAAREITKTHDIVFASRPLIKSIDVLFYGGKDLIFAPYGEFWRQMRRICTAELLSTKRVRSFRLMREEEVANLLQSIAASSGTVVNITKKLAEISNNVMARATIGRRCKDQELFFSALAESVELTSGFTAVDLFPSLPSIGRITGYQRKLEQCKRKLDLITEKIIGEHEEKMTKHPAASNDKEPLIEEDLIDVLLRIQREDIFQFPLSKDSIKAIIQDMLLAGSETTSTLLEWAMSELLRNPEIMKKAQREVREALGITMLGKLSEEEVASGKLIYLQLVIKETLRLHPPAPLLLPRENQESCEVLGYEIPSKTRVIINMWAIARDANYWVDPNTFWPERFEGNSVDFKGAHFEFMPFGAGRRICPGVQFGLATVEIVLAYLLYYFDWEYLGKMEMTEAFGITIRRWFPLCAVPTLRVPLPPLT
ncbi:5-epiaristolochene 1,3-dihydroxylase [Platanthera zijinensis]|uniref:5-epiaristolochene 1,3-dihydroxylase n=1 Tax=Platanthera zijinensis TaxID=2320716 RepID=A0AAP0BKU0_9ASPA